MTLVGPGQVPGLEVAQSHRRMRGIEMGCIGLQDFLEKKRLKMSEVHVRLFFSQSIA